MGSGARLGRRRKWYTPPVKVHRVFDFASEPQRTYRALRNLVSRDPRACWIEPYVTWDDANLLGRAAAFGASLTVSCVAREGGSSVVVEGEIGPPAAFFARLDRLEDELEKQAARLRQELV